MKLSAGQIVLVDWRDAMPNEANKRRPAVVVEDGELFDAAYPNVVLVPLADAPEFAIPDLSVQIDPDALNGCGKPCRALAHNVTATSKRRVEPTSSRITATQLQDIRRLVGITIGLV